MTTHNTIIEKPVYHDYVVEMKDRDGHVRSMQVWATDRTDAVNYVNNILRHCHPKLVSAHRV